MDDEQIPFATAPEPAPPVQPTVPTPVPLPLPTSVTGVTRPALHVPPKVLWVITAAVSLAVVFTLSYLAVGSVTAGLRVRQAASTSVDAGSADIATDPVSAAVDATTPLTAPAPEQPAVEDAATNADGSLVDTAAAVAKGLPGFDLVGEATSSSGDPLILVRSRAHPAFRASVDPNALDPAATYVEDLVVMFKGSGLRGSRFVSYMARLHPGVIVDIATLDPDLTDDTNLLWVTYVKTPAQVDDSRYEKELMLRWDPKARSWAPEK